MKKDETGKQVYLIVQSILCVLVAAALIAAVWQIYSGGMAQRAADPLAWIYTRDTVARKLAFIAPLIFLCLGMGYLSTRSFDSGVMNWIAEQVNTVGQGLFLAGCVILHRAGLRDAEIGPD